MIFLDQICPKQVFPLWDRKSEHHHWILHTWLSLGATFQLKLTILIFGPNFLNKYAVYLFGICCIKFTSRSNIFTENPKTLEILPFYRLYTKAWPKIRNLWVNLEKCERVHNFLRDLQSFHFGFKIPFWKKGNSNTFF